jgi:hypothetical protein
MLQLFAITSAAPLRSRRLYIDLSQSAASASEAAMGFQKRIRHRSPTFYEFRWFSSFLISAAPL